MRTMVTARLPGIELTLARALRASQAKGQIINRVKVKLNSYFLVFWEKFLIAWLHNVRRCCCYELMNADLSYCYFQNECGLTSLLLFLTNKCDQCCYCVFIVVYYLEKGVRDSGFFGFYFWIFGFFWDFFGILLEFFLDFHVACGIFFE